VAKTEDTSFAILVLNIKTNMKWGYLVRIITDQPYCEYKTGDTLENRACNGKNWGYLIRVITHQQ
jgi:hypothetical protein